MKLKFGDFIIVALVALLAAGSLLLGMGSKLATGSETAEVWQNGKLVRVINLGTLPSPIKFELNGAYHSKVVAEKGRIRFEWADCPDNVCVHTGWLTRAGQTAACVPNRSLIKVVGASEQDVVIR
jgi:hypothetical protein